MVATFSPAQPAMIADRDRLETACLQRLDELGLQAAFDDLDNRVDTLFEY